MAVHYPFWRNCLPILVSLPVVPHQAGTGTYAAGPVALVFDFYMALGAGCFIHGIGAVPMLRKALDGALLSALAAVDTECLF